MSAAEEYERAWAIASQPPFHVDPAAPPCRCFQIEIWKLNEHAAIQNHEGLRHLVLVGRDTRRRHVVYYGCQSCGSIWAEEFRGTVGFACMYGFWIVPTVEEELESHEQRRQSTSYRWNELKVRLGRSTPWRFSRSVEGPLREPLVRPSPRRRWWRGSA